MKKLIYFLTGPWPLLIAMALSTLVFTATILDWLYLQPLRQANPAIRPDTPTQIEQAQP
jgi:hypothetical protein